MPRQRYCEMGFDACRPSLFAGALAHHERCPGQSCRQGSQDDHLKVPCLQDLGAKPAHQSNEAPQQSRIMGSDTGQGVKFGATTLKSAAISARLAGWVDDVNVVAETSLFGREIGELCLGASAFQR
jgi:hypothetical protein